MADEFLLIGPRNQELYIPSNKHGDAWQPQAVDGGINFLDEIAKNLMMLSCIDKGKSVQKNLSFVLTWEPIPAEFITENVQEGWQLATDGDFRIANSPPAFVRKKYRDNDVKTSRKFVLLDAKWDTDLDYENECLTDCSGVIRNSLNKVSMGGEKDDDIEDTINRWTEKVEKFYGQLDRYAVLVTSTDISRHFDVKKDLSIERVVTDIATALYSNAMAGLRKFNRTIVTVPGGYLVFDWVRYEFAGLHMFYRHTLDNYVVERATTWRIPGNSYLHAAMYLEALRKGDVNHGKRLDDIYSGTIRQWLSAIDWLQRRGFIVQQNRTGQQNKAPGVPWTELKEYMGLYGLESSDENTSRKKFDYKYFSSRDEIVRNGWSLLREDVIPSAVLLDVALDVIQPSAERVARGNKKPVPGGKTLAKHGIPALRVNDILILGREQREQVRAIQNLLIDYRPDANKHSRPRSIAVFGPPGSGKSSIVKAMCKEMKDGRFETEEFNLSQLSEPQELNFLFHRVRDKGLNGKIPLVFWDEFDTKLAHQALGWLRYFLAPMEDGYFYDQKNKFFLGPCIFVFAGGTCDTFKEFAEKKPIARNDTSGPSEVSYPDHSSVEIEVDAEKRRRAAEKARKDAKLPDFLSRLSGQLDAPTINLSKGGDSLTIIRRALILSRLIGEKNGSERVTTVDREVGELLLTWHAEHGGRSLRTVIELSKPRGGRFDLAALPPAHILNTHLRHPDRIDETY